MKAELTCEPDVERDRATAPVSSQLVRNAEPRDVVAPAPDQPAIFPTIRVIGDSPAAEAALLEQIARFQLPVLTRVSATPEGEATLAEVIVVVAPHPEAVLRRARAAASQATHPEVLILGTGSGLVSRAKRCGLNGPAVRYLVETALEPALVELVFCTLPLRRLASHLVGRMSLKDVQRHVRTAMLLAAFTRASGSRRLAARMLGVTRPAVQQMLATLDLIQNEESR